jgi:hypothetical protein
LASEKKIDVHNFITTIFNPELNEFILSPSDSGMGQSISEGRIIYSKNMPHVTTEGYPLYTIRDDLFHLGASQSNGFLVDVDVFLQSLEPLYQYFLKTRGTPLSNKIENVLRATDSILENNHFDTKIAKNEKNEIKTPITIRPKSQVNKNYSSIMDKYSEGNYGELPPKSIESGEKSKHEAEFYFKRREPFSNEITGKETKKKGKSIISKLLFIFFIALLGLSAYSVTKFVNSQSILVEKMEVTPSTSISGDTIRVYITYTNSINDENDPFVLLINDVDFLRNLTKMFIPMQQKIFEIKIDGILQTRENVALSIDKSYSCSYPLQVKDPGKHLVSINNVTRQFTILHESRFDGSNFLVTPATPSIGEEFRVSIDIKNVGIISDVKNINLFINNRKVDEHQINLSEENTITTTYTNSEEIPGSYNITISGLSNIFTKIISVKDTINPITGVYKNYYLGLVKAPDGVQGNSYDEFIVLENNKNAVDPSYNQLLAFLKSDKTDEYPYTYVIDAISSYSGTPESKVDLTTIKEILDDTKQPNIPRICGDFAETLHNNAEKAGIKSAIVIIKLGSTGHALNAFYTMDSGTIYIDDTGVTGYGPSNCDKIIDVLKVGSNYVPRSLFPEKGWSSTWGDIGIVTSIYTTYDGNWNDR